MMDVKKQQDMSGFYRHLLNQTTGEEAVPDNTKVKKEVKDEPKVKEEPKDRWAVCGSETLRWIIGVTWQGWKGIRAVPTMLTRWHDSFACHMLV